jgi:SAM-dependent methyltransferase
VTAEPKEVVRRGYEAIGARYAEWAGTVASPLDRYLDDLDSRLSAGTEILDLGCGAGGPAARLARRHRLTCVDQSEVQLELAKSAVPHAAFLHSDMTALDLPAGSIGAVLALYSILHVPGEEQPALVRRIAGWLRPGGLFLATLGLHENPGFVDADWLGAPMFSSSLGAAAYLALVADAGLELVTANVETQDEHGATVAFLWVLARKL